MARVLQSIASIDFACDVEAVSRLGIELREYGPHALFEAFAGEDHVVLDRLAFRLGERELILRREHREVRDTGAQHQILLGRDHGGMGLFGAGMGLRETVPGGFPHQRLDDRQRVGVGRKIGEARAEHGILAGTYPLPRVDVLGGQAHVRQQVGARLRYHLFGGEMIELRGAKARVIVFREAVNLNQIGGLCTARHGDPKRGRDEAEELGHGIG